MDRDVLVRRPVGSWCAVLAMTVLGLTAQATAADGWPDGPTPTMAAGQDSAVEVLPPSLTGPDLSAQPGSTAPAGQIPPPPKPHENALASPMGSLASPPEYPVTPTTPNVPAPPAPHSTPSRSAISTPTRPDTSSSLILPDRSTSIAPLLTPSQPAITKPVYVSPWVESNWYFRADYFSWNEREDGADLVKEDGTLLTLGYARRVGWGRFRLELFGGTMDYSGEAIYPNGYTEPLDSTTNYLGVRGEFELLLEPDTMPEVTFFLGLGTRLWVRDLPDAWTESHHYVYGYQETWWTFYPYLGVEKRRLVGRGVELYGSGRIGCTPGTYEYISDEALTLHPRIGLTGQLEGGVRGEHFFVGVAFEVMTWDDSPVSWGYYQPASRMFTAGLRAGVSF